MKMIGDILGVGADTPVSPKVEEKEAPVSDSRKVRMAAERQIAAQSAEGREGTRYRGRSQLG